MLKKLHVNISFIDALSQMPMYAKFLKDILSKKRKIYEHETIALGEEGSFVIFNKLLAKLKDPIFKKFNLEELRLINISLQLAEHSINYPLGILDDILIKVGDFYMPIDFMILDMAEDART